MEVNFEIFKTNCTPKYSTSLCLAKVQHHYSSTRHFFQVKSIARLFLKCENP